MFVNLRPKNLNAVIVTGPTGFVWPRCRDGCRLLPEHRQFHRWRWGQALAAHRAGLKRVIIPQRNEKDLEELPANVRQDLSFITASCLDEVLNAAFDGGFTVKARPGLLNSKL